MNVTNPLPSQAAQQGDLVPRPRWRHAQPIIAYIALVLACLFGIEPSQTLNVAGHVLGEHWYSLYNGMLAASVILILLRARLTRDSNLVWRVLDLTLCCMILSWGLKGAFPHLTRPSGGEHGFPSGHALTAFAAAGLLLEVFPNVSPYAYLIAVAVGWSRVEIREHYTYQVLIGAPIGMLIAYAVTRAPRGVGFLLPRLVLKRAGLTARSHAPEPVSREGVWPPPPQG